MVKLSIKLEIVTSETVFLPSRSLCQSTQSLLCLIFLTDTLRQSHHVGAKNKSFTVGFFCLYYQHSGDDVRRLLLSVLREP